jgi:hypothetical protein
MIWLDHKYVNLLSGRLERFARVGAETYRFRCPICGDSEKDKRKTRGYVFQRGGQLRYFCHNCGASMRFQYLIKSIDPTLYLEYVKEKIKENNQANETHVFAQKMKPPVFVKETQLSELIKVSKLKPEHPVKQWVERRQIPSNSHYKLFYCKKFASWVNSIIPDKFNATVEDEPRLIIPFLDEDKKLFGFQGRSFKKNGLRYITIMLDESKPKIFGMDTIDRSKDIYLVEGPIDSLFIPNAIASAGSDLISQLLLTDLPKDSMIIVYDNEPRNKEIVKKIEKTINAGYRVCVWPTSIEHKDINDMVLAGYTPEQVKDIIDDCTYSGPTAKLHFTLWRKDR